jgi:hypothetical protein
VNNKETDLQAALVSFRDLASLETQTVASEMNLIGLLRDRLSPAARYGEPIQTRYRRVRYQLAGESEIFGTLSEGFSFKESGRTIEGGKPLTALLALDNYSTIEVANSGGEAGPKTGQYVGERLYLTRDKKWILAERLGAFSEEPGSTSEWNAECRVVADRLLLEQYSLETITKGLLNSTNKLWEKLCPRMDSIKKRHEKIGEITGLLSTLKSFPPEGPSGAQEPTRDTRPADNKSNDR